MERRQFLSSLGVVTAVGIIPLPIGAEINPERIEDKLDTPAKKDAVLKNRDRTFMPNVSGATLKIRQLKTDQTYDFTGAVDWHLKYSKIPEVIVVAQEILENSITAKLQGLVNFLNMFKKDLAAYEEYYIPSQAEKTTLFLNGPAEILEDRFLRRENRDGEYGFVTCMGRVDGDNYTVKSAKLTDPMALHYGGGFFVTRENIPYLLQPGKNYAQLIREAKDYLNKGYKVDIFFDYYQYQSWTTDLSTYKGCAYIAYKSGSEFTTEPDYTLVCDYLNQDKPPIKLESGEIL